MSKPKHVKLLIQLSDTGIGYLRNISPFLESNFRPKNNETWLTEKEGQAIHLFCHDLAYRGLITFSDPDTSENQIQYAPRTPESLRTTERLATITSKGLDYLDAYEESQISKRLNESYVDINRASKDNYRNPRCRKRPRLWSGFT